MVMPYRLVSAILAVLLVPAPGAPQGHVVTAEDVRARFAEVAAERAANLRTVEAALSGPAASEAAALLHTDLGRVRARLPSLTDEEMRDVAARAERLSVDPVAGAHPVVIVLAVLGAILVLAFVLLLIDCADPDGLTCAD